VHLLLVHNYYQQSGGEDDVFACERTLLEAYGHRTTAYVRKNDEISKYSLLDKASLALRTTWAWDSYAEFKRLLAEAKPDLVHVHNTFPLISPAVYYACAEAGIPVVQGLYNARLLCPGGNYYRDGRICKDCLGKTVPWPGALHGCYRKSRAQTAVVSAMLTVHNVRGTFHNKVDSYIVATEFYRKLFVEAGYPEGKLFVKPHFVEADPGVRPSSGDYALFIGRLSHEKGVNTLLPAWKQLTDVPLKVRGDGVLMPELVAAARENPAIEVLPRMDKPAYVDLVGRARFVVWPSVGYYETFGRVAIEAFAAGVPVLASNTGANAERVREGETGIRFKTEDPDDLAAKVRWAWEHPAEMKKMGLRARAEYERRFTPATNYGILMQIYQATLATHASQQHNGRT
jgi:glycosyltransferase involved in cell wall biosynthesis